MIIGLTVFSQLGTNPEGSHLKKIQESKNFNKERNQFVNRRPYILDKMKLYNQTDSHMAPEGVIKASLLEVKI